jgi:hypothetical protein
MMITIACLTGVSDADLLSAVTRAAGDERAATVHLIALLAELDTRRLYLAEGCSSLFTYCTQILHLSEHAAYSRIEAARCARRFPVSEHIKREHHPISDGYVGSRFGVQAEQTAH